MKIYTSYYSFAKNRNLYKVSISRSAPRDVMLNDSAKVLAPPASTLWAHKQGAITDEQYTEQYIAHLNANKDIIIDIMRQLWRSAKGQDIVLLCWESKGKFCHRHLFARWFFEQTGYRIEEL